MITIHFPGENPNRRLENWDRLSKENWTELENLTFRLLGLSVLRWPPVACLLRNIRTNERRKLKKRRGPRARTYTVIPRRNGLNKTRGRSWPTTVFCGDGSRVVVVKSISYTMPFHSWCNKTPVYICTILCSLDPNDCNVTSIAVYRVLIHSSNIFERYQSRNEHRNIDWKSYLLNYFV